MLVGYERISTDGGRQSADLQRDALIAVGVDARHIYGDKLSGSRDDRPGLKDCLAFLKPGDTLVVWKLDRLGRSLSHLLATVTDLQGRGVGFRSITEGMDTTTAQGKLLFSVFGALAEFERSLIRERVNAGLAAAAKRGRRGGRPPALSAEKIEAITKALDQGASQASVCRSFGVPRSTLIDTLKRTGWTRGGEGRGVHRRPSNSRAKAANPS
jgi:DNA invertase Pin-like site-specific DNA recombinase